MVRVRKTEVSSQKSPKMGWRTACTGHSMLLTPREVAIRNPFIFDLASGHLYLQLPDSVHHVDDLIWCSCLLRYSCLPPSRRTHSLRPQSRRRKRLTLTSMIRAMSLDTRNSMNTESCVPWIISKLWSSRERLRASRCAKTWFPI